MNMKIGRKWEVAAQQRDRKKTDLLYYFYYI